MDRPNAAYVGAKRVVERHFHLIGKTDVSRKQSMSCKTVDGSRAMHSVRSVGPANKVLLQVRNYSCFCEVCVRSAGGVCRSVAHASPWRVVTLEPTQATNAVQEDEDLEQDWLVDPDCNDLAMQLEIGDHFAIMADPEHPQSQGAQFFVLICTRKLYVVEDGCAIDGWGGTVERSDEVVEGLYYHQRGAKQNSYVLLDGPGPTRILSHLVCAIQFSMKLQKHRQKGGTSVYKLSDEALAKIEAVLRRRATVEDLEQDDSEEEDLDTDHEDSDAESEEECASE